MSYLDAAKKSFVKKEKPVLEEVPDTKEAKPEKVPVNKKTKSKRIPVRRKAKSKRVLVSKKVKPVLDEIPVCNLCLLPMSYPVSLVEGIKDCDCKCELCLHCVRDLFGLNARNDSEENRHLKCMICNKPFQITVYEILSKMPAHKIYQKEVKYANKLDELYGPVDCPRSCGKQMYRREITQHGIICPNMLKSCKYGCKEPYKNLEKHYTDCPNVQVTCSQCKTTMPISLEEYHASICPYREISCKNCSTKFFDKDRLDHPCTKLLDRIEELGTKNSTLQQRVDAEDDIFKKFNELMIGREREYYYRATNSNTTGWRNIFGGRGSVSGRGYAGRQRRYYSDEWLS